jgi:hypothetical protein
VEHLLLPGHLARRLTALDELDAILGDLEMSEGGPRSQAMVVAKALRSRLEAANKILYDAARAEIVLHGSSLLIDQWMKELTNDGDAQGPRPGLGFDLLDEIVCGVLQFRAPGEGGPLQSPEMTPYQPTPARHILDLIAACKLSDGDTLVDLGSGLGHVPLMVSILTGIRTVGVEIQPEYALRALEAARNLNLSRVRFAPEDARMTDLSSGTVFYLFSPFTGSILTDVLHRLLEQSRERQIRICSLGPSTRVLQDQPWLTTSKSTDAGRIAVFQSQ